MLGLRLATPHALFDFRDDALGNVGQVHRCADSALKDRKVRGRECAHSLSVRFECITQLRHNRDRRCRAGGFWFVHNPIPDGALNVQFFPVEVLPEQAAKLALAQASERRCEDNRPCRLGKNDEDLFDFIEGMGMGAPGRVPSGREVSVMGLISRERQRASRF